MKSFIITLSLLVIFSCSKETILPSTDIKGYPCDNIHHTIRNGCLCKDGSTSRETTESTCAAKGGVIYYLCQ